jgi:hypothetical protein
MTVEWLIKKLRKYPPRMEVAVSGGFHGESFSRKFNVYVGTLLNTGDDQQWVNPDGEKQNTVALEFIQE